MTEQSTSPQPSNSDALSKFIQDTLDDAKANDISVIDVRGRSAVTDFMFVASGTSTRHAKSIADQLATKAKQAGYEVLGVEGEDSAEWILVDLADALVHIMLPQTRAFYALEKLWEDGPGESTSAAGQA